MTEHEPDDRVSLAPLDPETALRALLAVDPVGAVNDETGQNQDGTDQDDS